MHFTTGSFKNIAPVITPYFLFFYFPASNLHRLLTACLCLRQHLFIRFQICLLYTSDAADEEDSVDFGGRRIIKKKKKYKSDDESKH